MTINSFINFFNENISDEKIMEHITNLVRFHRVQGSNGYHESAEYIISDLKANGIESKLHKFPADGEWEKWGWKAPVGWDIISGSLRIVSPINKMFFEYSKVPLSVITHSHGCDFEAELVDIGKGETEEDYKKAEGKVALITASPRNIFPLAAKHNVKGLIIHPGPERATNIGFSTVQYDGFWPVADSLDQVTSGFSISNEQYDELDELLDENSSVKVHLKIDAGFNTSNNIEVIDVLIKGTNLPDEEILFIGHLCHPAPSANDNASGAATLVEIAKAINNYITYKKIQLDRSIRFLWVPEFSGTIPWLDYFISKHPNKKIISCINLDMVGESPYVIGSPLSIIGPSITTPSILPLLLKYISKQLSRKSIKRDNKFYSLNYRMKPLWGGSDHQIFNDIYFKIPSIMLGHDDPYHHSTADTLDKVEPLECKSVAALCASTAISLANTNKEMFDELIKIAYYESQEDLLHLRQQSEVPQGLLLLKDIYLKRFTSLSNLFPYSDESLLSKLESELEIILKEIVAYRTRKETKYQRRFEGPISYQLFKTLKGSDEQKKNFGKIMAIGWSGIILELLNLIEVHTIEESIDLLVYFYPEVSEAELFNLVGYLESNQVIQ